MADGEAGAFENGFAAAPLGIDIDDTIPFLEEILCGLVFAQVTEGFVEGLTDFAASGVDLFVGATGEMDEPPAGCFSADFALVEMDRPRVTLDVVHSGLSFPSPQTPMILLPWAQPSACRKLKGEGPSVTYSPGQMGVLQNWQVVECLSR